MVMFISLLRYRWFTSPVVGLLLLVTASSAHAAELPECSITAFNRNSLTWQTQTGLYYNIEWATALGDDTDWNADWYNQSALLAASNAMTVSIPAFYRIKETTTPYLSSELLEKTFQRQSDIEMHCSTNWWHAIESLASFKTWYTQSTATVASGCRVIDVPRFGEVGYVMLGSTTNPLILVSHGGLMGYDNAYLLTNLMQGGYSILCPSRPGYPGTPLMPGTNDTFEMAADMFAKLLDTLSLTNRVFIFGTSAGGPTALQFAIRHQERVRGVLLFDAVSLPYTADLAYDDNFLAPLLVPETYQNPRSYKLVDATRRNPEAIMRAWFELVVLTNEQVRAELAATFAQDRGSVERLLQFTSGITPISQRYTGTVNDITIMGSLPDYPLHSITSPVFVSHSLYDGDVHIDNAYNVISNVSGSVTSFFFHGGGHLFFLGDDWTNITHHARAFMDNTF
ncbi:MAG: alpha/beta hydrolase [Spartobacteria bacterium]|nr:alpha/beta hydrolase [Spartobacteria bacterium]